MEAKVPRGFHADISRRLVDIPACCPTKRSWLDIKVESIAEVSGSAQGSRGIGGWPEPAE